MPIKSSVQFNRAVTAFMDDAAAANTYQLLMVKLYGATTKNITGIRASAIRQNNFGGVAADAQTQLGQEFQQARVIILAGQVNWDAFTPSQLMLGVSVANADLFQNQGGVEIPPILFDTSFINDLNHYFYPELVIESGVDCTIVMSSPLCPTDTAQDNIDVKIGYLNVLGYYDSGDTSKGNFPFILR